MVHEATPRYRRASESRSRSLSPAQGPKYSSYSPSYDPRETCMVHEATLGFKIASDRLKAIALQDEIDQMEADLAMKKSELADLIRRVPAQASDENLKQSFIYECLKHVAPSICCVSLPQDLSTNACKRVVRIGRNTMFYAVLLIDPTIRINALTEKQLDAVSAALCTTLGSKWKLKPAEVFELDNLLGLQNLSHKKIEHFTVPA